MPQVLSQGQKKMNKKRKKKVKSQQTAINVNIFIMHGRHALDQPGLLIRVTARMPILYTTAQNSSKPFQYKCRQKTRAKNPRSAYKSQASMV